MDRDATTSFGDLLRRYRLAAGLTQEELAERTSLGVRSIQHLEGGGHLPHRETVGRLIKGLGLIDGERREFERCAKPAPRPRETASEPRVQQSDRAPRHNLPAYLSSFVGRERELAEVTGLLKASRLLTITGVGGTGKTRLAVHVATNLLASYADGIWFVDLAPLSDPSLVTRTVASAAGVSEQSGQRILKTLLFVMRDQEVLLLLDNCEHLIDACARLAETILKGCPRVQILATSREGLGIAGETDWPLPPLAAPDPATLPRDPSALVAAVRASEAGRLFLARASSARPEVALTPTNAQAIASIVWHLDGMPLAIELAAARVKHLGVDQIAARLDDRFRLLTSGSRGVLARHQTLRALVDWSYDLLAEAERVLFRRLSVFAGGWTLEAAEAVGAGREIVREDVVAILSRLVDQSLVVLVRGEEDADRYRLLETLRQYARERLAASGEADGVLDRHAAFFLTLAEEKNATLWERFDPRRLDRLQGEYDNLRAALHWFADRGDAERRLRLSSALGIFWLVRGYLTEGQSWLDASMGISTEVSAELRADALDIAGELAFARADLDVAATLFRESIAIWRRLGERQRLAYALMLLGSIARSQCSYSEALGALEEGLQISRECDDQPLIAGNLLQLGRLALQKSELPRARALLENALAINRTLNHPRLIGTTVVNLGLVAEDEGDYPRAQSLYRESVGLLRQMSDRLNLAFLFEAFASLAVGRESFERGAVLSGAAATLRHEIGSSVPPAMQPRVDRTVQLAREALGEADFAAAWAEGQAMVLEKAIAYALEGEGS